MRSTTNPTALASRRLDWRRGRDRSSESALSRSDWVCWNVSQKMTEEELTKVFRHLGAKNPESWASSQIREGIPQLGRFLVIRAMWDCVTPAGTTSWIDYELKNSADSTHGKALKEMLDAGVSEEAITNLVRFKEAEALREVCYLLEDYSATAQNSNPETGEEYVRWGLCELDSDQRPTGVSINSLHESFWSVDPASSTG